MRRRDEKRTRALGVVIPVHNEERLLGAALEALAGAVAGMHDATLELGVVLVFDSCRDASERVSWPWQANLAHRGCLVVSRVTCEANNVGVARHLGCALLFEHWREIDPANVWIATTDADSRVPSSWLRAQVRHHEAGRDVWAGRVALNECGPHRQESIARWQRAYDAEWRPVHGASLGFNGARYLAAGGFAPLETGEDRALLRALLEIGATPYFDSSLRVLTSARRNARAPHGFAEALYLHEATVGAMTD